MVSALSTPQDLATETWVKATWAEFLQTCDRSDLSTAKGYYDSGWMRVETMLTGSGHSQDNTLLSQVVSLFGLVKGIKLKGLTGGSFYQTETLECQPDLAFYIAGEIPDPFPPKTTELLDVDRYGAPTLVIEISAATLNDDLGKKRLLYERLGVREYWVIDVQNALAIAFAVADGGSRRIDVSQVLPGLSLSLIEGALSRTQTEDDTEVNRWLMQQFQTL
jgi:Uma2 family endonuclease